MNIIHDFIKIINSRLTWGLLFAIFTINCVFIGFLIGKTSQVAALYKPAELIPGAYNLDPRVKDVETATSTPKVIFGSSKGKYFYYKGCGGTTISPKNLVYYKSEAEAVARGKTLYKSCE